MAGLVDLTENRLTVVGDAQEYLESATEVLEDAIIDGTFRNDSPELTKALAGLRQAQAAIRDLELFTKSNLRANRA